MTLKDFIKLVFRGEILSVYEPKTNTYLAREIYIDDYNGEYDGYRVIGINISSTDSGYNPVLEIDVEDVEI